MIYGHADILERLSASLPSVCLFTGPRSVGKWTLANEVRKRHEILGADFFYTGTLNADLSRSLVGFLGRASVGSEKLAIVRIDNARHQALNALLKTLEELPVGVHVILIAEHLQTVPDTIRSRAEHYRFGYLNAEDLKSVLITAEHVHPSEAEHHAAGGGAVSSAVPSPDDIQAKSVVLRALSAIQGHDAKALDTLSVKWTDRCTELLRVWCAEALSTRWKLFQPEELEPMSTSAKLRILLCLKNDIRPKLVVRASLMTLLTQGL